MLTISILALSLLAPDRDALAQDRALNRQVQQYLNTKQWPEVRRICQAWKKLPEPDRRRLAAKLLNKLTNRTFVKLHNTYSLEINYRFDTGDLDVHGQAGGVGVVAQDLFTVGGRSAWALSEMYSIDDLAELNAGLSIAEWNKRVKEIALRFTPEYERLKQQVALYLNTKSWPEAFCLVDGWTERPKVEQVLMTKILLKRLADRNHVELHDADDIIIYYRVKTKDMDFHPRIILDISQDLFTIGGRAVYAMSMILEVNNLPELNDGLSQEEWTRRVEEITARIKQRITSTWCYH